MRMSLSFIDGTVLVEYITAGRPLLCFKPPFSVKVPVASGELWSISGMASRAFWSDLGISSSQSVSGSSPAWAKPLPRKRRVNTRRRMKVLGKGKDGAMASILALYTRLAQRALSYESALFDQAVDHQQHDRTDQRADEPGALPGLVNAQRLAAVGSCQRTADTQQNGHDPAHAVITRFQEPRQQANNQADKDGSDNSHGV